MKEVHLSELSSAWRSPLETGEICVVTGHWHPRAFLLSTKRSVAARWKQTPRKPTREARWREGPDSGFCAHCGFLLRVGRVGPSHQERPGGSRLEQVCSVPLSSTEFLAEITLLLWFKMFLRRLLEKVLHTPGELQNQQHPGTRRYLPKRPARCTGPGRLGRSRWDGPSSGQGQLQSHTVSRATVS